MTTPRGQAIAAAGNADRALAEGLPAELLVALATASNLLAVGRPIAGVEYLAEAVAHPAARFLDEVLVARIKSAL